MGRLLSAVNPGLLPCALLLGASLCASCATSPRAPADTVNPMPTFGAQLVVRPGDVLKIEFPYHPELNAIQTVRPDGKISLRLVNEVDVAGLEPEEVRQRLLEGYNVQLKQPEITVVVQTEQRFVYVGGEVALPAGQFPIRVPVVGPLTPMEAIMQAGGLKNASAKISNVLIIRRTGDKQYARTIDLRTAFRSGECEPFFLEPGDIVFVPRTNIDRANQWVAQYMNKLVPEWIRVNLGYSYVHSDTTGTYSTITTPPILTVSPAGGD